MYLHTTLVLHVLCTLANRFESDYDLRGCLGKGGFGVVYHVKNRTDGGEYAIKRIKLPNKSVDTITCTYKYMYRVSTSSPQF